MLPVVKRVIEVLTSVAEKLESDAIRVDAMLPKLSDAEREGWKQTAADYRKRAAEYRANDFIKPDTASVR
jgi:hypothetical protein